MEPLLVSACLLGRCCKYDGGQNALGKESLAALRARYALLKSRSPSCGAGVIYDGTFTHTRIPGDGVAAELLRSAGLRLYTEQELSALLDGDMPPRSE